MGTTVSFVPRTWVLELATGRCSPLTMVAMKSFLETSKLSQSLRPHSLMWRKQGSWSGDGWRLVCVTKSSGCPQRRWQCSPQAGSSHSGSERSPVSSRAGTGGGERSFSVKMKRCQVEEGVWGVEPPGTALFPGQPVASVATRAVLAHLSAGLPSPLFLPSSFPLPSFLKRDGKVCKIENWPL